MMSIWDLADGRGNVTVADIAAECGVDKRTVYKWIECDLIPARRLPSSGYYRIKAADVVRFIVTLEHQPASRP